MHIKGRVKGQAFFLPGLALAALLLSGCGGSSSVITPPPPPPAVEPNSCTSTKTTSPAQPVPTSNVAGPAFTGVVRAGQAGVAGARVQLYAAGTAGNGSAPAALLATPLITDANGMFSVATAFTCALSNTVLYVVATGGSGVVLASVLGTCGSIAAGSTFTVNELSTVATAYAMSQFLTGQNMGATATNSSGIALAAATAMNLVDAQAGTAPGAGFPATGVAPTKKINSLANVLHACVASSAACTELYSATTTATAAVAAPTNTFAAAINLAKQPSANVGRLYTLSQTASVYQPALAAAPADWTLAVNYGGGGMNAPSSVAIDSTGRVWVSNYFAVASLFTNTGTPVFPSGITGDHLENSYGAAMDVNDSFWIANEESSGPVNGGLGSISVLTSSGSLSGHYIAGGINFPLAVAFDTSGVAWVVDYGDSGVTLLDGTGTPLSGTGGYTSKQLVFPVAVATDAKCNAYVANQASNTLTRVIADGSEFKDYAVGDGPSGVAVDAAGNVWSANYYGDSVGLISAAGDVLSGNGYTGGGLAHPQGIAADGVGNVWVANYRAEGITELAAASSAAPGAFLSPSAGYAADSGLGEAFGLAIDASGNVWVTSFGTNALTEFVGLAAPVQTPLLGPVRVP